MNTVWTKSKNEDGNVFPVTDSGNRFTGWRFFQLSEAERSHRESCSLGHAHFFPKGLRILLSSSVGASLIATWLYSKLAEKPIAKLSIGRTEVEIDDVKIAKVIKEKITAL
jgi:hypothetical protein